MTKPILFCAVCAVLLLAFPARALDTLKLLPEGPSKKLLEGKKPIRAGTRGIVPVNFDSALEVLDRTNLLTSVQNAYSELIDEDGVPEFAIQQTASNTYYYVNRKGERTDITEVRRGRNASGAFDIVLYSAGKRSFGNYEAVIHIRVTKVGATTSQYVAAVYAYPENAFSRFFARHLGLVERYFKKKTTYLTKMITTIALELCRKEDAARDA